MCVVRRECWRRRDELKSPKEDVWEREVGGDQAELRDHVKYFDSYSKINEKPVGCLNRSLGWKVSFYKTKKSHIIPVVTCSTVQCSPDFRATEWKFLEGFTVSRWGGWQLEQGGSNENGRLCWFWGGDTEKIKSAGPGGGLIGHSTWKKQGFKDNRFQAVCPWKAELENNLMLFWLQREGDR